MAILETENLKKYYGSGDTQVRALDGVNLAVENGEFVAIVGTSGSGKSTLLHMLGGLDRPTSGKVMVDGKDIFSLKDEALTIFRRRKIGFVFQSYNLVPVLSVYENIVLPLELDGRRPDRDYLQEVVTALGLEKKQSSRPNPAVRRPAAACGHRAGAGGKARHPSCGRAYRKPGFPDQSGRAGTDEGGRTEISQTMVMITHNEEIAQMADRIVRIEDGRIVSGKESGNSGKLLILEWRQV